MVLRAYLRTRSAFLCLSVLMLFLVLVAAGCGGSGGGSGGQEEQDQQQASEEQQSPVVGEFVGEVPNTDAFFALIAEEPQEEAADERNIRAYLCDGKQLSEWFVGTANANEVSLTSEENGLQLLADLYSDNVTGTISFQSGENFGFEVPLATGVSGLYPVTVPALGGTFSATSFGGAVLEGTRIGEEQVSGTINAPDNGEGQEEFSVSDPNLEEGEDRWIVLPEEDGQLRIKGAKRRATSSGFIDPTVDERSPGFIDPVSD